MLFLGQNLYTRGNAASLEIMDKQIYRLIGKATTLAAYVNILQVLLLLITVLAWRTASVKAENL